MASRDQVAATRAVVRWYLAHYHGTREDLGGAETFVRRDQVGAFAVAPAAFTRGDPPALFRMFLAMTLFQRRQDQQVLRILRGISSADARELTSVRSLEAERLEGRCRLLGSSQFLHDRCDLTKVAGKGTCGVAPRTACHLKRHTVLLKRYGHFGKVPTSAALMLREWGVRDLGALRAQILGAAQDPAARALKLEQALMRVWRVNRKISAMFLSAVCNPDLSTHRPPWVAGIDWTRFVVIDSNTDLFLKSIGYRGAGTYDARLQFIQALARRIDLSKERATLHAFNPRIVQQAMYMFMSRSNRRVSGVDCLRVPLACSRCIDVLASRCSTRHAVGRAGA